MLKAVFKMQLIPADSPLLSHSSATLFWRGTGGTGGRGGARDWPQFVKTRIPFWVDWNHFSTQRNVADKTDLLSCCNKLRTVQRFISGGGGGRSSWVRNENVHLMSSTPRIINPILCLEATDWLHASVTHSNPGVSIGRGGGESWNIFLGMVSDAGHEIFIIGEPNHNGGGGGMRGFDLQNLRGLNHAGRFLPWVVTHKLTLTWAFLRWSRLSSKPFNP